MEGNGVICLAVDILPTEFAKEVGAFLFLNSYTSIWEENAIGLENDQICNFIMARLPNILETYFPNLS